MHTHAPRRTSPPRCSKNTTFGASDVLELVSLLESGTAAPWAVGRRAGEEGAAVVRPSRWVGEVHWRAGCWVGRGRLCVKASLNVHASMYL